MDYFNCGVKQGVGGQCFTCDGHSNPPIEFTMAEMSFDEYFGYWKSHASIKLHDKYIYEWQHCNLILCKSSSMFLGINSSGLVISPCYMFDDGVHHRWDGRVLKEHLALKLQEAEALNVWVK